MTRPPDGGQTDGRKRYCPRHAPAAAAQAAAESKNERIMDGRTAPTALSKSIPSEAELDSFRQTDAGGREKALRRNIKTAVKKGLPT